MPFSFRDIVSFAFGRAAVTPKSAVDSTSDAPKTLEKAPPDQLSQSVPIPDSPTNAPPKKAAEPSLAPATIAYGNTFDALAVEAPETLFLPHSPETAAHNTLAAEKLTNLGGGGERSFDGAGDGGYVPSSVE